MTLKLIGAGKLTPNSIPPMLSPVPTILKSKSWGSSALWRGFTLFTTALLINLTFAHNSTAYTYIDSFEGGAINPFWSVDNSQYGSISLSANQSQDGSRSLMLSSTSGGQRDIRLIHTFSEAMIGTASVWFYDGYPGQSTLYSHFMARNSTTPALSGGLGIQDWDPGYYHAAGLQNEGQTNLARSLGWHQFEIAFGQNSVDNFIDGLKVSSISATQGFDQIYFELTGPFWRPDATYYFDNFQLNLTPLNAVPEPDLLSIFGLGLGALYLSRHQGKALHS